MGGLSPVIATVLLIAMVVIIALIIFLWFKNISGENITKFNQNIKLVCDDVDFDVSYSGKLYITNNGETPIYGMKIREIDEDGSYTTEDLTGFNGLISGQSTSITITITADKIILIPVLKGLGESGEVNYDCDDKNGYELEI